MKTTKPVEIFYSYKDLAGFKISKIEICFSCKSDYSGAVSSLQNIPGISGNSKEMMLSFKFQN